MVSEFYLENTAVWDELHQVVVKHQLWMTNKAGHNNLSSAKKVLDRYDLWPDLLEKVREGCTPNEHLESKTLLAAQETQLIGSLSARPIHGVYYEQATSTGVEQEAMFAWLSNERFLVLLKHGHHGF